MVEDPGEFLKGSTETWQLLVHVCRRWRCLIFGSPRRLNLRLLCTPQTPGNKLDIWPALPLLIQGKISQSVVGNTLAILKRHNRVSTIDLTCFGTTRDVEKVWTAMRIRFPELTVLRLWSGGFNVPLIPDSFLGRSAPRLRQLILHRLAFPGLPKLLLSATHLTKIYLWDITPARYISPEMMVTCLSTLTSLKSLYLGFALRSHSDRESLHPPLPTRSILPALTRIQFKGTGDYLGNLVARIDTPQLKVLSISLINGIDPGVPQLAQFISRTPIFKTINEACVGFCGNAVRLTLSVRLAISSPTFGFEELKIQFSCEESNQQLSTLARIWTSFSPLFFMLDSFFIHEVECLRPRWQDNIEHTQWLEILRPFISVQSLYVSREFAPSISTALQELVRERTSEVLPALQYLFLEGLRQSQSVQASIGLFVAARQLVSHPIAVSLWIKDADID